MESILRLETHEHEPANRGTCLHPCSVRIRLTTHPRRERPPTSTRDKHGDIERMLKRWRLDTIFRRSAPCDGMSFRCNRRPGRSPPSMRRLNRPNTGLQSLGLSAVHDPGPYDSRRHMLGPNASRPRNPRRRGAFPTPSATRAEGARMPLRAMLQPFAAHARCS